jgi:[ribosomal protein S18]-alanine N-acetyltransferase
MHVRPATLADVPVMMRLAHHSATAAHWSHEQYDRVFSAVTPPRLALIIEETAGVQGFLIAKGIAAEWELENIAIAGPARRRGLGTRLLGEFLDHARAQGASTVFLEVRESNRAARSLYEKWAFEETGRRVRYYQNPDEDAIVYRLAFV